MKLFFWLFLLTLTACSSNYSTQYSKDTFGIIAAPNRYIVKKGDTLFSIAWRFGMETLTIQRLNGLGDPNKIFVGQKLRLQKKPTSSSNKASKITRKSSSTASISRPTAKGNWAWPMRGQIVRYFNPKKIGANGIRITGKPNQTVNAAESGVVAYKGNGLNGYGNVVIIKHKSGLFSAYGFLSKMYVKEGQHIRKREKIGTVGYAANKQLMLHFEVRKNGRPVNPRTYIGRRYHF
ncbi:MAG: peptidoglycan DD-metalloendopeptidase family protein [Ostreibacterium sp.]